MIPLHRRTLLPLLLLAACGETVLRRTSFPPLRYDYLTPIRLNVASVDFPVPDPGVAPPAPSPVQPGAALRQMGQDRVSAGGSSGQAVFVIDQASIVASGRTLNGTLAVHLDVLAPDGTRAGFAEARVSRINTGNGDIAGATYDMLKDMLDAMNVEFEYQVRRSLRDWLQETASDAPAPAPVQQENLDAPARPSL